MIFLSYITFPTYNFFIIHLKNHYLVDFKYPFNECIRKFSYIFSLKSHIKRCHLKNSVFQPNNELFGTETDDIIKLDSIKPELNLNSSIFFSNFEIDIHGIKRDILKLIENVYNEKSV